MSDSILEAFRLDNYRLGDVSVIPYDRKRHDVFGDHYLFHLYQECLNSRPNVKGGILADVFCGFADLSADAVCSYLANKPLILLCVHTSPTEFTPAGFAWPVELIKSPTANSAFCAFAFFRQYWGTPESIVLGMLGLSYFFTTLNLRTILGQRRESNILAGRYMRQFGAVDLGTIPDLLRTHDGGLENCIVSALARVDFEQYCTRQLLTLAGEGVQHGERPEHRTG
jgi:hypothetical protein